MKRLQLGLTDIERNAMESRRRTRNCLIAVGILALIAGMIGAH